MGRLFHPDSPAVRFLTRMAELVALNLLWIVCCLPLITVGPSTTAMYCVARAMVRREHPSVARDFFKAFKANFKQALVIWLILLIPVVLVLAFVIFTSYSVLEVGFGLKVLCWVATVIVACVWTYVHPLMAGFDNTVGNTLKNALLLPLANPIVAVMTTVLNWLPLAVMLIDVKLFSTFSYVWLVIGGAFVANLNAFMLDTLFSRFAPAEPDSDKQ